MLLMICLTPSKLLVCIAFILLIECMSNNLALSSTYKAGVDYDIQAHIMKFD